MSSEELVSEANRAKAKARIYDNNCLNQQCLKDNRQLKISINFGRDKQAIQLRTSPLQTKVNLLPIGQSEITEKAWREKKQVCRTGREQRMTSSAMSQNNIRANRTEGNGWTRNQTNGHGQNSHKKKKRQNGPNKGDITEIIY